MGDFSVPVAKIMRLMKTEEKNPAKLAQTLYPQFQPTEMVKKITVTGPYLNFTINKAALTKMILSEVDEKQEKFGSNEMGTGIPEDLSNVK